MFKYGVVLPFLLRILIRMRRTRTTLQVDIKVHITNTRKSTEDIAVSVAIRFVILSLNVFKLYIVVQGPES